MTMMMLLLWTKDLAGKTSNFHQSGSDDCGACPRRGCGAGCGSGYGHCGNAIDCGCDFDGCGCGFDSKTLTLTPWMTKRKKNILFPVEASRAEVPAGSRLTCEIVIFLLFYNSDIIKKEATFFM